MENSYNFDLELKQGGGLSTFVSVSSGPSLRRSIRISFPASLPLSNQDQQQLLVVSSISLLTYIFFKPVDLAVIGNDLKIERNL